MCIRDSAYTVVSARNGSLTLTGFPPVAASNQPAKVKPFSDGVSTAEAKAPLASAVMFMVE